MGKRKKKRPEPRFNVWSQIDRGEGSTPRYANGYYFPYGVTRDSADRAAETERQKPYVTKVEIREVAAF